MYCLSVLGLSWVMLEFGNAFGFLFGPLLIPNPPSSDEDSNQTMFLDLNSTFQGLSFDQHWHLVGVDGGVLLP